MAIHADIHGLAGDWEELASRCGAAPFLYPGWIAAWTKAFGGGTVQVATLRAGERLVALLPLVRRRAALVSPANWHTPLFGMLAENDVSSRRLLAGVLALEPSGLDLAHLEAESPLLNGQREALRSAGYRTLERVIERSPYVSIRGDWDSYEARIPGRKRSKFRRFRRRLEERGRVEFEAHDGRDGLDALLDDGLRVEAAGWKGEQGTAIKSEPSTEAFYREVASWAADRGWLQLWFMHLDERAIAFAYCLETTTTDYELKVGFDPEYARFGPGVLLTQARLRHAFDLGLRSFEFLGQPEPHKLAWTDTCRERIRIQAFAPTPRGEVRRMAWRWGRPAVQRVRKLINS